MATPDSETFSAEELTEAWPALSDEDRVRGFDLLSREHAEEFFSHLSSRDATGLVLQLPEHDRQRWLRSLPPDDIADIVQEAPEEQHEAILGLLEDSVCRETEALLEYDEDDAGGLMTPRYARLRENMTVAEAISYLRKQARQNAEWIYYGYVEDAQGCLVGVVSFRELVISPPDQKLRNLMTTDVLTVPEDMDQEEVSRIFARADLYCVPVVDQAGRIQGIITADDIVDVVAEEATEDMQKIGGTEALEAPYLQAGVLEMLRKRGVWLIVLLLMGFVTVEVMKRYEDALSEMVVLALFIPLIISCGGNTGSQASTLVVRAMALGEVRLRDWLRVVRRELVVGLGLGALLAGAGMVAALLWNALADRMGESPFQVIVAVGCSIVCVVLWGTLAGSMLPFILRRCGADPASASAPLVATIVDASGLVIYFTVASVVLHTFAA